MKLGFDLDEVIVALGDLLVDHINNEFNIQWTIEDFIEYDLFKNTYTEDVEYNSKIAREFLNVVKNINFQSKAKPYEEAPAFIRSLARRGHSIHFISSRDIGFENKTVEWLRKYKIPFNTVHHVGPNEKGPFGRSLNLDCYVDDHETHLESMYKYKKRWRKGLVLMTRPWNRNSYDSSKFVRVDNFKELKRHLGIHKR